MTSTALPSEGRQDYLVVTVTTSKGEFINEVHLGRHGAKDSQTGEDIVGRSQQEVLRYIAEALEEALRPGSATDQRVKAKKRARSSFQGMARHRRRQQLSLVSNPIFNQVEDSRCLAYRKNAKKQNWLPSLTRSQSLPTKNTPL